MLPEQMVEASIAESWSSAVSVRRCRSCRQMLPETADYFYFWSGRFTGRCKPCIRASRRVIYRQLRENAVWDERRRERNREAQRRRRERERANPWLAVRAREQQRRARERRRQDPVRYQRYLEDRRIRESIRRREAGIASVPQRSNIGSVVDAEVAGPVPVEVLQRALRDSRLTTTEVARRLGWTRVNGKSAPDSGRVERRLGLRRGSTRSGSSVQTHVGYGTALALVKALDVDPVDYGL